MKLNIIGIMAAITFGIMSCQDGTDGTFTSSSDVGEVLIKGSNSYKDGVWTLSAAGFNMWDTQDAFYMVWTKVSGDFELSGGLAFEGEGTNPHRKAGFIIRESLEPDARYADIAVHGVDLTSLQFRQTKGGITEQSICEEDLPKFIRLTRKGDRIIAFTGADSTSLVPASQIALQLPEECYVGMFICSHEDDVVETVKFSDVSLKPLASEEKAPEVRSILNIYDTETDKVTEIASFDKLIEAPNWTSDGKWLVYNSGGMLFKIAPEGGESYIIPTGQAMNLNNDHVLAPDSITIFVSAFHDGSSKIFRIEPSEKAVQITPEGPSYLHGVSPDGKTLAYVAGRAAHQDRMQLYTMSTKGGEETRITNSIGLDDGPEYSPDGKYIWFNSVRTGLMQVWRCNADGSNPKQMTTLQSNNWFPHVSPDGKQVVFLAFGKGDVDPGDHPANKNVKLYLMPSQGGTPKELLSLFGGQGTINVNSWAPDSKRFGFVSYEIINK